MKKKSFDPGIIIGTVFRIAEWFYNLLKGSFIAGVIAKIAESVQRKIERNVSISFQKTLKRGKRHVARLIETSFFTLLCGKIASFVKKCRLRVYATFFLSWGLYSLLATLLKHLSSGSELNYFNLIFALTLSAFSLPLFFSDKTLSQTLEENFITNALLFSAMGLSVRDLEKDGEPTGKMNVAFLCGLALGIISYAASPLVIAFVIFAVAICCVTFISPEFALTAILFLLPFLIVLPHPSIILAGMVLLVTFSLSLKLLRGKRIVRFEKLDFFVLLFMVAELLGGIVTMGDGSSLKASLIYCCFILGYFLTVALMKTKKWLSRGVKALSVSSAIVALYGIYQYLTGNIQTTWLDTEMFSDIEGRACSTFENPNMLAVYLIMVLPIVISIAISEKSGFGKMTGVAATFLLLACTVLTWSRGGWIGLALGIVVFLLILSSKTLSVFLFGFCALPFVPAIIPSNIWNRLASIGNLADTSTSYRVNIWKGTLSMLGDFWGSGIGVGQSAFSQVYPSYSLAAIERAPHSHNLFLQILTELGVGGLALFIILLVAFAASTLNYMRTACDKKMRIFSGAAFCGILAALMQGMTEYIWYNYRIFFVFWVVLGLSVAFRRCGQASEEHDSYKLLPGCV